MRSQLMPKFGGETRQRPLAHKQLMLTNDYQSFVKDISAQSLTDDMESINDHGARAGLETSFYADATGHAGWKGADMLSAPRHHQKWQHSDFERERAMLYQDYAGGSGPTQRKDEGSGKILSQRSLIAKTMGGVKKSPLNNKASQMAFDGFEGAEDNNNSFIMSEYVAYANQPTSPISSTRKGDRLVHANKVQITKLDHSEPIQTTTAQYHDDDNPLRQDNPSNRLQIPGTQSAATKSTKAHPADAQLKLISLDDISPIVDLRNVSSPFGRKCSAATQHQLTEQYQSGSTFKLLTTTQKNHSPQQNKLRSQKTAQPMTRNSKKKLELQTSEYTMMKADETKQHGVVTPKARIIQNRFQLGDKNYVIATSAYEKQGLSSRRGSSKAINQVKDIQAAAAHGQSTCRSNVGTPSPSNPSTSYLTSPKNQLYSPSSGGGGNPHNTEYLVHHLRLVNAQLRFDKSKLISEVDQLKGRMLEMASELRKQDEVRRLDRAYQEKLEAEIDRLRRVRQQSGGAQGNSRLRQQQNNYRR
ncbi:hypothetical protein FGO68_gene15073 [Halteria grandinella]|uniref:Uncharacterized protein n=1 Tax=Halteria grandinella TaxID=5974 RepID=A0A8J8NTA4_HALGN|nr:hypothetical protein FGO68_gene15073 [Halteria grandinella]